MSAPAENLDLDSRSWIEKNARLLFVVVGILLLLGGVWAFVSASSAAREEAAALAAAEATTAEDFLKVAREFSGTQRAAIAYIQAASLQNFSSDWEGLRKTAEEFLKKYPHHAAEIFVNMSLGAALDALGEKEAAVSVYQKAAEKRPDSFRAPEALFRAGVIRQELNNKDEARVLFDSILQRYPASIWAGQARERLAQLTELVVPPLSKTSQDDSSASATAEAAAEVMPEPGLAPGEATPTPAQP